MFLRHNIVAIIWSLAILLMCGIPGSSLPDLSIWDMLSLDKFTHAAVFALLCLFCIVGFRKQTDIKILRIHAKRAALLYGVLFGIVTELMQALVFEERTADLYDVLANILGCFVGVLLFRMIYGKDLYYKVAG